MKNSCYDVFISYRREDGAEFAEGLTNTLLSKGYKVFFDKTSLREGEEFPQEIQNALLQSSEFISVITKAYFGADKSGQIRINNEEDWVKHEVEVALRNKNTFIHPILIDCDAPAKNSLPKEIKQFSNKNFFMYNRAYDTYEKVSEKLINEFHDKTNENALMGQIFASLDEIDVHDDKQFNVACKRIINLIKQDNDIKALLHILDYKQEGKKKYYYNCDLRFIVFYVLFTFYRRGHETIKLIRFVEKYKGTFSKKYSFMNFVMTEYNFEKFNLAENSKDEKVYLKKAISYAKNAVTKNPTNLGIKHSFSVAIALAMESGLTIDNDDISKALEYVNYIIAEKPEYGGIYYSTRARLLSAIGDYEGAIKNIRYAQAMEKPDHDDWILRIANYQKYEILIRMKSAGLS